ncbi:zinc metallopeptidase [Erysipelothrix urinaevulpis]|uniref:zinc metallopeptidase n=1 Tax=Erysipelothrix urinaevulpis TaxID=2683717 RepID=UPI00135C2429|nr:zinc metallopeptidase [Erysipelothrix urinaevulpis]
MRSYLYFTYAGYGFIIIAGLASMFSQMFVRSSYSKYSKISTISGKTGADVARQILNNKGINDVEVIQSRGGTLSDHYDPTKKVVALSPKVYADDSIASVSVAAHEVGHAIQHAESYGFIALRNKVLPLAIISSKFSFIPLFFGFMADNQQMFNIGILLLSIIAIFQLVTLPVEFDASNRAIKILRQEQILTSSELAGSKKMLTAAALTYVAALFGTIMSILRYVAIFNNRNRD